MFDSFPAFRKEKKEELTLIKLAIQYILLERDYIFKAQVLAFGTTEQYLQWEHLSVIRDQTAGLFRCIDMLANISNVIVV